MRVQDVRALFPAVTRATYLNAAAASPLSEPVHRAITDHYREALEQGDVGFMAWLDRKEAARAKLAWLCGGTPAEIAFTGSTSVSFNLVARMLQARGVTEIVTLAGEFPSTTLPFLNLGFTLRVVRPREDGAYAVEDLAAAITPRTGAIAVSAVQYASGYRIDLGAVSQLCRARGLLFAVNVVQALGQVPIDVRAIHADFACGTSHKWLMGGYGVGWLYVRQGLLAEGPLPMAGWLSTQAPAMAMDNLAQAEMQPDANPRVFSAAGGRFRSEASALEAGSPAWGPLFGLDAALELLLSVGIDPIRAHIAGLQRTLRQGLRSKGFVPTAPDDPAVGSGICVVPVDGAPTEVARALFQAGVVLSPRGGGLRIATHLFNTAEDVERLFWALDKVGVRPGEPARSP